MAKICEFDLSSKFTSRDVDGNTPFIGLTWERIYLIRMNRFLVDVVAELSIFSFRQLCKYTTRDPLNSRQSHLYMLTADVRMQVPKRQERIRPVAGIRSDLCVYWMEPVGGRNIVIGP